VRLFRHLAARTLGASLISLAAVVAIFLVVDLVDNAHTIRGQGWLPAALELYANKAAVVVWQTAPAAFLLGGSIAASALRQSREWTAMRSLGLGPWRVALPAMAAAALAGAVLLAAHDRWGVHAAGRADELQSVRFSRGGSARRFLATRQPKRWFRGADGRRIYDLQGRLPGGGFARATILEVTPDFRLIRRIDAGAMEPVQGGAWRLRDVEVRTFGEDGAIAHRSAPELVERLDEPPGSFDLVPGRPAQLDLATLTGQVALRERLGQPAADFRLERANRFAYPLAAVPGVLLAVALALRRRRRGHLATSLLEAVGLSMALWGAQAVAWALGLSGRLPPALAAALPDLVVLSAGALAMRRAA
jgi:lipopolysaccharide export system permease protein